jgi:hypothetical protein
MCVVQVFQSFVMLSLACVFVRDGLPSVEMWFDRGEDRCCCLNKVGMVETVEFRQVMWLVMLKAAKDRILGVDTLGQYVPPRVRYGMGCLLIRNTIRCVSCSVEWAWHHTLWALFVNYLNHMVQCHTRFLCQNKVLIICMTHDQLFHTYGQKCSQITKCHE